MKIVLSTTFWAQPEVSFLGAQPRDLAGCAWRLSPRRSPKTRMGNPTGRRGTGKPSRYLAIGLGHSPAMSPFALALVLALSLDSPLPFHHHSNGRERTQPCRYLAVRQGHLAGWCPYLH